LFSHTTIFTFCHFHCCYILTDLFYSQSTALRLSLNHGHAPRPDMPVCGVVVGPESEDPDFTWPSRRDNNNNVVKPKRQAPPRLLLVEQNTGTQSSLPSSLLFPKNTHQRFLIFVPETSSRRTPPETTRDWRFACSGRRMSHPAPGVGSDCAGLMQATVAVPSDLCHVGRARRRVKLSVRLCIWTM
jgi:hypothetical protein